MMPRPRLTLILFAVLIGTGTPLGFARISKALPDVVDKLDARQAGWLAMKATVEIHFSASNGQKARCLGSLIYHRLDEKILLACQDPAQKLLFRFKTSDREFELYLPGQNTRYLGNIFQLEDSPAIESHLKPLDLYRALKLTAIPQERAKISHWSPERVTLRVFAGPDKKGRLQRELQVLETGEVPEEFFFNAEGKAATQILREDFRELQNPFGRKRKAIFPYRITIKNTHEGLETRSNQTVLLWKHIDLLMGIEFQDWQAPYPEGVKTVKLED